MMNKSKKNLLEGYEIDREIWQPMYAITVSWKKKANPRGDILENMAGDFLNRVASLSGVHLLPSVYRGDERTDSRDHLHLTVFVERRCEKKLHHWHIMKVAETHKVFRDDRIKRAIKPVSDYEGWREYKVSKHKRSFMWISCPRKRSACRGAARKGRAVSCALLRGIVSRLEADKNPQ